MDYSKLLKNYRLKNFLTQRELSDLLGVSVVTVNRWETKKFKPTIKQQKRICEFLNIINKK